MISLSLRIVLVPTLAVAAVACGGDDDTAGDGADPAPAAEVAEADGSAGIRVVSPVEAAATIADAPADLVILDIRTQQEFDQAHIEDAVLLDFYREDFADELAEFDTEVPYVLYCRSGNRSSQARAIMADLGFESVDDIDGGIVGWAEAGLPLVTPSAEG